MDRGKVQTVFEKRLGLETKTCREIEKGIYNWCIDTAKTRNISLNWADPCFHNLYIKKSLSVLNNLDPESHIRNPDLIKSLRSHEIDAGQVASMPYEKLFPERWKDVIDRHVAKLSRSLYTPQMETDRYRCKKCGQNRCSYYEMQIRSGDESTTIFVSCINCNNNWRIN